MRLPIPDAMAEHTRTATKPILIKNLRNLQLNMAAGKYTHTHTHTLKYIHTYILYCIQNLSLLSRMALLCGHYSTRIAPESNNKPVAIKLLVSGLST